MSETKKPYVLTDARLNANRENAKKSTGPATAEGKAESSRNRLVHGLRANKHILLDENPEDFLLLLQNLDETFHPVGEAEEMLVTRIAADQWRLDRALPMEAGIFRDCLGRVAATDFNLNLKLVSCKKNHELDPNRFPPAPAPPDPADRLSRAFNKDSIEIASLTRYQASIQLSIDRGLRQLKVYQAARIANAPHPDEPPSPPHVQPVSPAPSEAPSQAQSDAASPVPAATPAESANYHSNPRKGAILNFPTPATGQPAATSRQTQLPKDARHAIFVL